jgi:excisionase family DNA binding protein
MTLTNLPCELSSDYDPAASYDTNKLEFIESVDEERGRCIHLDVLAELEKCVRMLSVEKLAEILDVSPNLIRKQIRLRKLPCVRVGDTIRLNPSDVVTWLQARANRDLD